MAFAQHLKKFSHLLHREQAQQDVKSLKSAIESRFLEWQMQTAYVAAYFAVLRHFQLDYFPEESVSRWFETASAVIEEYYWGDWWTAESIKSWLQCRTDVTENQKLVIGNGIPERSPTYTGPVSFRREHVTIEMLVTTFSRAEHATTRIADWHDLRIEPSYCNGAVEDEYQFAVLYMISCLRSTPMAGIVSERPKDTTRERLKGYQL